MNRSTYYSPTYRRRRNRRIQANMTAGLQLAAISVAGFTFMEVVVMAATQGPGPIATLIRVVAS